MPKSTRQRAHPQGTSPSNRMVRRRRMSVHQRRWARPYAVRTPADWAVTRPGDLVQLDTLDMRPLSDQVWKQFTARDVVSRWDTVELGRRATAVAAAAVLDRLAERMPFREPGTAADQPHWIRCKRLTD